MQYIYILGLLGLIALWAAICARTHERDRTIFENPEREGERNDGFALKMRSKQLAYLPKLDENHISKIDKNFNKILKFVLKNT